MKVPPLNFEGGPGVPLLNLEGVPGVPLLNFRGVPGSKVPRSRILGSWSHFYTMPAIIVMIRSVNFFTESSILEIQFS